MKAAMAFEPDIIVTGPDGPIMVIEAKVALKDLPRTEEALKRYMVAMQYPFGLLITPEQGWVYRDSYSSLSPTSVERVEAFDSAIIWRQTPPREPLEFETSCRTGSKISRAFLRSRCRPSSRTSFRATSFLPSLPVK
jgi:hypothetical protein